MTTLANQEIETFLRKAAKSDLRLAKKNGCMAIAGTKIGNVELVFEKGLYSAVNFNNTNIEYFKNESAKNAENWLITQYVIEY